MFEKIGDEILHFCPGAAKSSSVVFSEEREGSLSTWYWQDLGTGKGILPDDICPFCGIDLTLAKIHCYVGKCEECPDKTCTDEARAKVLAQIKQRSA